MTTAVLPLAVLLALEESADAHLRCLRQALHAAQEACPHTDCQPIEPADAEDVPRQQCRACRKIGLFPAP